MDNNDGDEEEVATRSIIVQEEIVGGKSKDKAKTAVAVIEGEDGEKSGELRMDRLTVVKKVVVGGKARKKGKEAAMVEPTCPKPRAIRGASLVPEKDKDNNEDFEEEEKGFVVRSSPYNVYFLANCIQPRLNCPGCAQCVKMNKECWLISPTLCEICKKQKRKCPGLIVVPEGMFPALSIFVPLMRTNFSSHYKASACR